MDPQMFKQAIAAEESQCRRLAQFPGWHDYLKDKARRLAKQDAAMYGHLPQLVAQTIREAVNV